MLEHIIYFKNDTEHLHPDFEDKSSLLLALNGLFGLSCLLNTTHKQNHLTIFKDGSSLDVLVW